jgi:signal peptidase I
VLVEAQEVSLSNPALTDMARRKRAQISAYRWFRDLVLAVAIAAFIIVFLYQPVKVEGTSMMPVLVDQERVFINKFIYRIEPIRRGDIVVFAYPGDPSKSYVKRVIGLPGDRVRIDNGLVYVNGQALVEPYVPPQYFDPRSCAEERVPQGSLFVLGDHRTVSNDSRDFGPVADLFVTGKAVFVYWPINKAGKLH